MVYNPAWGGYYHVRPIVEFDGLCHHIHSADDYGSSNIERRAQHHKLFRYLERELPITIKTVGPRNGGKKQYLVGVSTSAKIP
jgi:hypothetical protein